MAFATDGLVSQATTHPSPHKGLFIYNGPIGTEFGQRSSN